MERIPTPKISEILKYDFMKPIHLSAYALAKAIHVPTSRIQDLLHGRRRITPDTSIRIGRFFGVSDGYLLRLQYGIDLRNAKLKNAKDYSSSDIKSYKQIRKYQRV